MSHPSTGPLQVNNVVVDAWGTRILHGVTLNLHPGEMCAIIGPSGAGKSTLVKVLLGIRQQAEGQVALGGNAISDSGPVGYVPQYEALHDTLSTRRALDFACRLRLPSLDHQQRAERIDTLAQQVGLDGRLDVRIRNLSGGQRKRVSVAMELLTEPGLLILDEPTSGLDPGLEGKMMGLFSDMAHSGRIVLVITHAMESLDRAEALLILMQGRTVFFGPPQDALRFFRCERYADIFGQLPKQQPQAWSRKCLADSEVQQFLRRAGPAAPLIPGSQQSEATTAAPTRTVDPQPAEARPTAEEQLAALKKELNKT